MSTPEPAPSPGDGSGMVDLSLPDDETLIANSAPNPRTEHERLAAGNPREITELGTIFARAGGDMDTAYQLSQQAQQWVGQGYTNDGTPVYDQRHHVAVLPRNFPDASGHLTRIGGRLGELAVRLATTTNDAADMVDNLIGVLAGRRSAWQQRVQSVMGDDGLIPQAMINGLLTERDGIAQGMQTLTNITGQDITGIITAYEGDLADAMTMLADIGYLPPDAINTGPGGEEFSITGAATDDAERVAAALALEPGAQSQTEIDAATQHFRYLDGKLARGDHLTADDRAYINQFTTTLGPDGLAAIPEQVEQNVAPQGVGDTSVDHAAQEYLDTVQPISNALTATSTGPVDTTVVPGDGLGQRVARYEDMPAALREMIDTRPGVLDPITGQRFINQDALLNSIDPRGGIAALSGGVTGLNRVTGAAALLQPATVAPGAGLSEELTRAAVRTKQDLNAMQSNTGWMLAAPASGRGVGGGPEATQLDALVDDRPVSDLLSVAARNVEGSSAALTDPEVLAPLLGLNWEAADGAAAVVTAGTQRDPALGGGGMAQAEAALAVVREVATDPRGYNDRMSAPVVDAVQDVGSSYIDAFGASTVDTSGTISDRSDSVGRPLGPSFQLTSGDSNGYLQFVAGSGDDRAAEFQAHAKLYSHADLTAAMLGGDTKQMNAAMNTAGRLDGAITQAYVDNVLGDVKDEDAEDAARYRATEIEATADRGLRNSLVVAGRELVLNRIPGASSVSAVVAELLKGYIALDTIPPVPPEPELPGATNDLVAETETTQVRNRDLLLAGAMAEAGLFDGPPPAILTSDRTGGPDGGPDGVVDPPGTSSVLQDELSPAVRTALSRHGIDPGGYDDGRSETYTPDTWSELPPPTSPWAGSDDLYYGDDPNPEPRYDSHDPNPVYGGREPDPRRLDDYGYDHFHRTDRG